MIGLRILFSAVLLLSFCLHTNVSGRFSKMNSQAAGIEEANRMWERAIAAKGGREKLHSVSTLVVSSKSTYSKPAKDMPGHQIESLYVLPNKLWEWQNIPGPLGVHITVVDFERSSGWEISGEWTSAKSLAATGDFSSRERAKLESLMERFKEAQLIYLMETRDVKPTILGYRRAMHGRKTLDVVETSLGRERIEFYLNPESHLAEKIVIITKLESGRDYVDVIRLDGYVAVGGIQLPQRVLRGTDEVNQSSYLINVSYDKAIFERPPTNKLGPDAWKLSGQ